jgi:hypothetical protein
VKKVSGFSAVPMGNAEIDEEGLYLINNVEKWYDMMII